MERESTVRSPDQRGNNPIEVDPFSSTERHVRGLSPTSGGARDHAEMPLGASDDDFSPSPPQTLGESGLGKMAVSQLETMDNTKKKRIGERLMELGLISEDQLQIALQEQRQNKKLLGQILVEMNFLTDSALGEVLAESAGTQTFDEGSTMLDPNLLSMVPKEICLRNRILPLSQDKDGSIGVIMADVYNVLAIDQVRRHFPKGTNIRPMYCPEGKILELIDQYYEYEISIDGILREIETGIRDKSQLDGREEGYVNPTVRLVNALLIDAIKLEASDIHFEPEGTFLRLRYRIDGKLQQIRSFHRDYWAAMCVRMKIISGMNIAESRNPQDGRIAFKALGRDIDFRVATQPTVHGENIVMRILDKSKALVPMEKLGFSDHNEQMLKRCLRRPEGIIIVTGPTGSGKTTTLYSMLSFINSIDVNIMTLEDPVEYQLPLIRQTNVREGSVDFHSGIKALMRQDPDIIFVGEVRDEDTALMAIRAALTGHQVFTTLHTNDALGAIPRLSDIGVPAHLLAGSLVACLAQRLARKLCPKCKRPKQATEEECRVLGVDPAEPPTIYEAVGCTACLMKGNKGRTAIVEILRIDKGLDELIATHATRNHMMEYALENGFIPMVQDGIAKVLKGDIALNELIDTVDLTDRL
jgi:type IV pilus assembly protein PilB